jgi:hypothetical protein
MGLKEAYQEKADAQLHEWKERIEKIKFWPVPGQPFASSDSQRAMQRLDDCCRIAQVRLDELRSARDDRWEFAKQAVERAMIDLKRALDESGAAHSNSKVRLQTGREHVYEPFQPRKG